MNIPARCCTGYLGDIACRVTRPPWTHCVVRSIFERTRFTFDARHNHPRIGRVVIARSDAADVAISTTLGAAQLSRFTRSAIVAVGFRRWWSNPQLLCRNVKFRPQLLSGAGAFFASQPFDACKHPLHGRPAVPFTGTRFANEPRAQTFEHGYAIAIATDAAWEREAKKATVFDDTNEF